MGKRDWDTFDAAERRLERMRFKRVAAHALGEENVALDFSIPTDRTIPGIGIRSIGSSIIAGPEGTVTTYTFRLPSFDTEEVDPTKVRGAAEEARTAPAFSDELEIVYAGCDPIVNPHIQSIEDEWTARPLDDVLDGVKQMLDAYQSVQWV